MVISIAAAGFAGAAYLDQHQVDRQELAAAAAAALASQEAKATARQADARLVSYYLQKFPKLARAAGVPVIKLHEARHSAASLARDAGVDPEIRRKTLGHADQAMTSHYTHI